MTIRPYPAIIRPSSSTPPSKGFCKDYSAFLRLTLGFVESAPGYAAMESGRIRTLSGQGSSSTWKTENGSKSSLLNEFCLPAPQKPKNYPANNQLRRHRLRNSAIPHF